MAFLKSNRFLTITIASSALFFAAVANSEVITIDSTNAANQQLQLPHKGSSKAAVQRQFGQPIKRISAVGKPPISRWIYNDFAVVFEYNHVVHAYARLDSIENLTADQIAKRPRNAR